MPSNLLKPIKDSMEINNDPSCAPLTKNTMLQALKTAQDDDTRIGRATALIPKVRVEIYPNALMASRDNSLDVMEGRLPLTQRFKVREGSIDVTPYLTEVQTAKSSAPGALGTCSIRLKRNAIGTFQVADSEALEPINHPDKTAVEWLQILEDNDVVVVHLETGVADTHSSFVTEAGTPMQVMEVNANRALGQGAVSDRYSVAKAGRNSAPMVFFGFIDSVRRVRSANGFGGESYSYEISCSDFSKAMSSKVTPFLLERDDGVKKLFTRVGMPDKNSLSIDVICAHLLKGLMQTRTFKSSDLSMVENALKRIAETNLDGAPVTSAPLAPNSASNVKMETDQLLSINKLIFSLMDQNDGSVDRVILNQLQDDISPSLFLMPKPLTALTSAFDNTRIGALAPIATLVSEATGAQLGELMMVHTGYSGHTTTMGESMLVDYLDLTATAPAPMSGVYDVPSYLTASPKNYLQSLSADMSDGLSLDDVLSNVVGNTMGAVEYRYDLADYYSCSAVPNDNTPVVMPTLFIHSRTRPLNAISDFEIDAHLQGHADDESNRKRWATEHQLSLLEWMSTPVNLISETDIITESLQRDGGGRATLLHSSLMSTVTNMTSINAAYKKDTFGTSTGAPLYFNKAQELIHGHLPISHQSKDVFDQTAIAPGLANAAGTNVVFTKHRDDILQQPIELKGTIVVACLLASARVGQRLSVFRTGRQVGDLETFKYRWAANLYGLHSEFLDASLADPNSKKTQKKITAAIEKALKERGGYQRGILDKIQNSVSESLLDMDGAIFRSWFFAHFDSFLIEEVTHGVEINPQDGTIQATTALVVSYGAFGRETPAMLSTHPALSDPTAAVLYGAERGDLQRDAIHVKLATKPQHMLTPETAPAKNEINELLGTLRQQMNNSDAFIDRWRENGQDAALFRDVEQSSKLVSKIEQYFTELSTFYLKGTTTKKALFMQKLDHLNGLSITSKPNKIPYPHFLRKPMFYAHIDIGSPLQANDGVEMITLDYWKDSREVYIPNGLYHVGILQTAVHDIIEKVELDIFYALDVYEAAKRDLAESMRRA